MSADLTTAAIEIGDMLIVGDRAVLHADEIIDVDDRIDGGSAADQVNDSAVAETEVAWINGHEIVLESGGPLPDDAGRFAEGGHVLADFAFLSGPAVGPLLVVTRHGRGITHIHQFAGALVREFEMFSDYNFAALVPGLGSGLCQERAGSQSCQRQGGENNHDSLHVPAPLAGMLSPQNLWSRMLARTGRDNRLGVI